MKVKLRQSVFAVIALCFLSCSMAQTRLYSRIMIVENGTKKTQCSDDAHFLTFTDKGVYESDKNGFAVHGAANIAHMNDNNGYHTYHGKGYYGTSFYYFNSDYSRLNVKVGNLTYVYVREPGLSSKATKRKYDGDGTNVNVPMPTIDYGVSNTSQTTARQQCGYCRGTGKGVEEIVYATQYVANDDVYCSICGKVMSRHTHIQKSCPICHGKGYTE